MGVDVLLEIVRQMLWMTIVLSMPVLGTAVVVGLAVGLIQAITSIQEQTLSFIPKLLAMVLVMVLLGSWMTQLLVNYTTELIGGIARWGAL